MSRVPDTISRKLRYVRLRCDVNVLLEQLGWALAAGGLAAGLMVLFERATATQIPLPLMMYAMLCAAVVAAVSAWLLRRPSRMQVGLLIDARQGLKERFSSSLALAERDDAFARAAVREAGDVADRLTLSRQFPIRLSRRWAYATAAWAAVAAMYFFMPPVDIFGREKARLAEQDRNRQLEQAAAEVRQVASLVKATVNQLGDSELNEQLAQIDEAALGPEADQIRRQAIRKLGDLSDRLKKNLASEDFQSAQIMRSMLTKLRPSRTEASAELNRALAKGDYAKAAELIRQFQKQLSDGNLSPQDRLALEKQLADLADQLKKLAEKNDPLADELDKLGLDRELAKLSQEKLKEALQRTGLSEKQISELLARAGACRRACGNCASLCEAMGCCGAGGDGLDADELAALAGQLDALEALQTELALTEASLDEIDRAVLCLGQCSGGGAAGPWAEGLALRQGRGTGGPGRGYGPRDSTDEGDTSTYKTRAKTKTKPGPVIASWYFKGSQIKGESRRELTGLVQAAKDRAAEAISDNTIPRRYETSVKRYFTQLEEQTER